MGCVQRDSWKLGDGSELAMGSVCLGKRSPSLSEMPCPWLQHRQDLMFIPFDKTTIPIPWESRPVSTWPLFLRFSTLSLSLSSVWLRLYTYSRLPMLFYRYPDAFSGRIQGIKLPKKLISERRGHRLASLCCIRRCAPSSTSACVCVWAVYWACIRCIWCMPEDRLRLICYDETLRWKVLAAKV
jgi:hypothetical protein